MPPLVIERDVIQLAATVETVATVPEPPPPVNTRASLTAYPVPAESILKVDEIPTEPTIPFPENPEPPPPDAVILGWDV